MKSVIYEQYPEHNIILIKYHNLLYYNVVFSI